MKFMTKKEQQSSDDPRFDVLQQIGCLHLKISSFYSNDVNASELIDECQFAKAYFRFEKFANLSFESMFETHIHDGLQNTFPNSKFRIFLRIIFVFVRKFRLKVFF